MTEKKRARARRLREERRRRERRKRLIAYSGLGALAIVLIVAAILILRPAGQDSTAPAAVLETLVPEDTPVPTAIATPIPMVPTCRDYPANLASVLEFNLETCKRVLEGAGVQDYDNDGMLEFMSGSPQEINLNFALCVDSAAKSGVANRFREDMASIGLQVTVHELTWENYLKALEEGEIQIGNKKETMDMYYGEVQLRSNFDLTELLQTRDEEKNGRTNINFSRSNDASIEGWINSYLKANDASRTSAYYQLAEYITRSVGSMVVIGFERQQIITHRGVCKGIETNAGNPLYNFANWTIELD